MPERAFRIHGDNIVECERTMELVVAAFGKLALRVLGPFGSPFCPTFTIAMAAEGITLHFTFLPGYGRWNQDILEVIRQRGGRLREATDAILTRVERREEVPLLAIEFCGALPAGNQAWQRNGRAYSFGHAKLPYVYIAELGGYELDSSRQRKAERLPNPAVPFSYLLLSAELDSMVLPVFLRSPGASEESARKQSGFYGREELLGILRALLLGQSVVTFRSGLEEKALALVEFLSLGRGRKDTLPPEKWREVLTAVSGGARLSDIAIRGVQLPWSKTASIKSLTRTARSMMDLAAAHGVGLTSTTLPFCLIPSAGRVAFASAVIELYPGIEASFAAWLMQPKHLAICWVMGFKPGGDDARPDRGLPPLARMTVGDSANLLSVVYGPAPADTYAKLEEDPIGLASRNGLWQSIMVCSDAVLIDSQTADKRPICYTRDHWATTRKRAEMQPLRVEPVPTSFGENDVDTVLHLSFARLGSRDVFESMCNPPGGDWSGLSLLTEDRKVELRWLSLPRVTSAKSKRPDHVFQLFGLFRQSLTVAIESKERGQDVETGIGRQLTRYIQELTSKPPAVERGHSSSTWRHSGLPAISIPMYCSCAAFLPIRPDEIEVVARRAQVDLAMGFSIEDGICAIAIKPCSSTGRLVADFFLRLPLATVGVKAHIYT